MNQMSLHTSSVSAVTARGNSFILLYCTYSFYVKIDVKLQILQLLSVAVFVSSFLFLILKAALHWPNDHNQIQPHLSGWKDGQRKTQTTGETNHVGETPARLFKWTDNPDVCYLEILYSVCQLSEFS